jgi:hypothetical protein
VLFSPARCNAFNFLQLMMPFCYSIYNFVFLEEKIISPFKSRIQFDSVASIGREGRVYVLKTKKGKKYFARNVVIATQIHITKKLLKLEVKLNSINVYTYHINGLLKKKYDILECQSEMFSSRSRTMTIQPQADGSCLFFTTDPKPDFDKYFVEYEIIGKKYWNPAFHSNSGPPIACQQGKNLYMTGDYNVWSLEDSFITGIYAANQIIKNSRK